MMDLMRFGSSGMRRGCAALSDLSGQRSIDHTEEVSDRALIRAELRIVIGVRPQGDDLLLCLAGGLEFCDALACVGEHGPIVAHHRLGAGRPVARHDLGVLLYET